MPDEFTQYPFRTDHDVMIALVTDFNTTITSIRDKIAEDHASTLEVKTIVENQYNKLSDRIRDVEDTILKLDPEHIAKLSADVQEVKQWQHDFNRTKHIAWVVASVGFLAFGYYIPFFINSITSIWWNLKHP